MIQSIKECIEKCHDLNLILDVDYVILLNELDELYQDQAKVEELLDELEDYIAEKEDI